MKKFINEFKTFAVRGNAMDLAIGVIIGSMFSAIIKSLVDDIVMPLLGVIIGGIDFATWTVKLPQLFGGAEPPVMRPGAFINTVITFVLVAFTVFIFVKFVNRFAKKAEAAPPEPTKQEQLLAEIRDILKDNQPDDATGEKPEKSAQRDSIGTD